MTLHQYPDLLQGSEEWLKARLGIVTASEVGTIITPSTIKPADNMPSRAYAAQVASERITGWVDEGYVSPDMYRGWIEEPRAIAAYTAHRDVAVTLTGLMVRDDWGWSLGYSPDGLVDDEGLIEIKSRKPKVHLQTVISGKVPAENMAQIQCGLLVSGRKWCDYVSYAGGMKLWIRRVYPDSDWQAALIVAVESFEEAVEQMVTSYHTATLGLPMTERSIEQEMQI